MLFPCLMRANYLLPTALRSAWGETTKRPFVRFWYGKTTNIPSRPSSTGGSAPTTAARRAASFAWAVIGTGSGWAEHGPAGYPSRPCPLNIRAERRVNFRRPKGLILECLHHLSPIEVGAMLEEGGDASGALDPAPS